MKKIFFVLIAILPLSLSAQLGIGIKGGINFSNVTNASSINAANRSGFHFGIFLAPQSKGVMSSRTELEYSRQGYNFNSGENTGNVNLDYLLLPQLMGINISKFVQIQVGGQMALLLNAKAVDPNDGGSSTGSIMDLYNKFDFSVAGGVELHPVSGLLIGARYNLGLGKIYKDMQTGEEPAFAAIDAKNNIVQISIGWIFGNQSSKKKDK